MSVSSKKANQEISKSSLNFILGIMAKELQTVKGRREGKGGDDGIDLVLRNLQTLKGRALLK